jgi:hypothetical protein
MTDSIIILAGGKSKRWGGEVKYLKEVCGEPVLHRTQRLVTHFRPDADVHTIGTELQRDNPNEVFALLNNKWSTTGMTYLLLGDVSWMKGSLKRFLDETWPFVVYGRNGPNQLTGRPHEEIFGFAFNFSQNPHILRIHIDSLLIKGEENQWDIVVLHDLYRRWRLVYPLLMTAAMLSRKAYWYGVKRLAHRENHPDFVDVGESVTDDFDEPGWYEPYCKAVEPERLIDRETPP